MLNAGVDSRVDIRDEMRQSYVDYAMSVIVGRALPDVRDGLKPVHRRTLYAMHEMNLTSGRPYRKSARVVGDVMGKYHPHGDAAIYDALVRMAQDFSMRYPLVDGQGNFGSQDGDPAAAMRYTEVRLARITDLLLDDIGRETVDFIPNYDESLREPTLLPARLPNLLVNGSSGIAVGMATNIPPHNLSEVIDGLVMLIEDPDATIDDLMTVIKGPDFPTGAFICGTKGVEDAYRTGRGHIKLRARAMAEKEARGGKEKIVITEIPYQVNKAKLVEKIADLVRNKTIEGITDIRDESDKSGTRVVIELRKDQPADAILHQLYARTQMETTFGAIFLGLINNQPRIMNLKELLETFIYHRREVIYRRTAFELRKAEEKAHILEGLKKAVDNLDRVIQLIRRSASPDTARHGLMRALGLTQTQAQAILDMRLQRLTGLERKKIVDDYESTLKDIQRLRGILESDQEIMNIMKEEFSSLKKSYGDPRKTEIGPDTKEIKLEDMITEEDMVVTVSNTGYIKRNPISLYRAQRRGGKGTMGMQTREEDFVEHLFVASTHNYMLFFSNIGKVHWLKVYDIPQAGRAAKGKAIVNLLQLEKGENITAMMSVKSFEKGKFVFMVTKNGIVKKTSLSAYSYVRKGGIIALKLDPGDELISVSLTDNSRAVLIGTHLGQAICFKEDQVREMGRTARGVIGIKLRKGDRVVGATIVEPGSAILSVTENGFGKRTPVQDYRVTRRGGLGVTNIKCTERNGYVAGIKETFDEDEIMIISAEGKIVRLGVKQIRVIGRNTQGVKLIDLGEGDKVVSLARLIERDEA